MRISGNFDDPEVAIDAFLDAGLLRKLLGHDP